MYAVIETGGRQYKVAPGEVIEVNRLPVEVGQTIDLGNVLLIGGDENGTVVGQPTVANAAVRAKVAANFRSRKIIVFKYKNKVRYRRFNTHRQDLTRLVIKQIVPDTTAEVASMIAAIEAVNAAAAEAEAAELAAAEAIAEAETEAELGSEAEPAASETDVDITVDEETPATETKPS